MAFAASMLRSEMRRHFLMNFGLVASCVTAGTVVTNERGLFVPIEYRMSDTARAFAAMFTQSHLLPDRPVLSDVRMVSPLEAFEVTADSRDLRRRLMEAANELGANNFGEEPDSPANPNSPFSQALNNTPTTRTETTPLVLADSGQGSNVTTNARNTTTDGTSTPAGGSTQTVASNSTPAAAAPATSNTSPTTVPSANNATQQSTGSSSTAGTGTSTPVNPTVVTPTPTPPPIDTVGAVPEPSTWAMLISGFGFIGYFLRASRRRKALEGVSAEG